MSEQKQPDNIRKKLMLIQDELVCPKGQVNSFGNYSYRSCEDILGAVKPLNRKYGCLLTISDHVETVKDDSGETRHYLVARATLYNTELDDAHTTQGLAREVTEKRGMDPAQVTGAASSYSRKYALCGLYAIDDGVDADSTNTHGKSSKADKPRKTNKSNNKKSTADSELEDLI